MITDGNSITMATSGSLLDKSKELQKEILMEKLRSKTSLYKNLAETSKGVRMTMLVCIQYSQEFLLNVYKHI